MAEGSCCRIEKPTDILTWVCASMIRSEDGGPLKTKEEISLKTLNKL